MSRKSKRDALTPPYCEIPDCEYTTFYQRHRIVPGRDGGKYKLGNVIALCPNHHAEADAGLIPAEDLLEIVRKRIEESGEEPEQRTPSTEITGSSPSEEPLSGDGDRSPDAGSGLEAG